MPTIALEDATELYMVEVIAQCELTMLQLISCRLSICIKAFAAREVRYTSNSRISAMY